MALELSRLKDFTSRNFRWICVAIILLSVVPRLARLDALLLNFHGFRQTQTAITVRDYVENGYSVFYYRTPVLGAPFYAPFEFPVYQTTALVFCKMGISNVDVACRLASIFYYLISCAFLVLLLNMIFKSRLITLLVLLCYCFLPYSISWSRNCSIEFCVLTFSLAYLYFFLSMWDSSGNRSLNLVLVSITGSLAFLVKPTTAYPYVIIILLVYCYQLYHLLKPSNHAAEGKSKIDWRKFSFLVVSGIFVVLIPAVLMTLWTRHADALKMQSAFSAGITSSALKSWNFGTIEDRLTLCKWDVLFQHVFYTITPIFILLTALPSLIRRLWLRDKHAFTFSILSVIAFLTVLTLFNLYYRHEYYALGLLPIFSVITGLALTFIIRDFRTHSLLIITGLFMSLLVALATPERILVAKENTKMYLRFIFGIDRLAQSAEYQVAQKIQKLTKSEDLVVIADFNWSSEILYYADRKGLMWLEGYEKTFDKYEKDLDRAKYDLLVAKCPGDYPKLFEHYNCTLLDTAQEVSYYKIKKKELATKR